MKSGAQDDALIRFLHGVIRQAVRVLAILMVAAKVSSAQHGESESFFAE